MTFRVLVRRFANSNPYTFALCHTLSEVEDAADEAEILGWPLIEFEEIERPVRMPRQAARASRLAAEKISQSVAVPRPSLWDRFWQWFLGRADA